jgi:hypothetical protein
MPVFAFKRYRRSAPGATTGTVTDEWRFSASSMAEAEGKIRRMQDFGPIDWKKDFATLEDEFGDELAVWHHGMLHA